MISGVTVIQQQQQQQQISFLFLFCVRFENSKDPKMAKFFQTFRANKLSRRAQFGGCEGKFKNCRNLLLQDYWNIHRAP